MKLQAQKRFVFMLRSLLWATSLYVILMLAFNWDDINVAISGKNNITIVADDPQLPPYPCVNCPPKNPARMGIVKGIIMVVKTVTGFAQVAARG